VDDHILLDIGAVADFDVAEIPPQNGPRTDVAVFPDGHPSDENCAWMDKRSFPHFRLFSFELVDGHFSYPFWIILGGMKGCLLDAKE
jgi:hypothetical protein